MIRFPFVCVERLYIMRNELEKVLKEELRYLAIDTRERLGITQLEMGSRLEMSENSYSAIEPGRAMCGTLTTVLLLQMQSDPRGFLERIASQFEQSYEKEYQTV